VLLRNALGNPDNVANLLLLQLHVRVEDAEVELLNERQDVQLYLEKFETFELDGVTNSSRTDFIFKELVLQGFITRINSGPIEKSSIFLHISKISW